MPAHDPGALREVAVAVASEAAELLAEAVDRVRTEVGTKSSATDVVTEMDRASEALIAARLAELRPDDGLVGEEGTDRAGTSGLRWVVDPLDGTTNYLYRHPFWNVSVGVEAVPAGGGPAEPIAGCVVVPSLGETFAAAAGRGATCNGEPIDVGDASPLATTLVATGFNYDADVRTAQAEVLARLVGRVRDVRRGGAAAADLCGVACGRLDAYYETGLAPWDRVAGTVIAREAGARVEVLDRSRFGTDVVVAAHPERFDDLVDLLVDAGHLR